MAGCKLLSSQLVAFTTLLLTCVLLGPAFVDAQDSMIEFRIDDEICSWSIENSSKRVFASVGNRGEIIELDFDTGKQVRSISLSAVATRILARDGLLVCGHGTSPIITLVDLKTNDVLRRIRVSELTSPVQIHDARPAADFILLSGLNSKNQTVIVRLNLKAARVQDRLTIDEPLLVRSLSPDGKTLVGQNARSRLHVYDVSFDQNSARLLRWIELENEFLQQANGFLFPFVGKSDNEGGSSTASEVEFPNVPNESRIIGFDDSRNLVAAAKWINDRETRIYASDRWGSTDVSLSLQITSDSNSFIMAQFFGDNQRSLLAIGDRQKLRVFDTTKIYEGIGEKLVSPIRKAYRIRQGRSFSTGLNYKSLESSTSNRWSIVSAPDGVSVDEGRLKVSDRLKYGNHQVRLQVKNGQRSREFSTTIRIVDPELNIGFVPISTDVSPDRKIAVAAGEYSSIQPELVVVDLALQKIVQRISLKETPSLCRIGKKYIYAFNVKSGRMEVYSRENAKPVKQMQFKNQDIVMYAMADGSVIYLLRKPGPHTSSSTVSYRWCSEAEFLEQDLRSHFELRILPKTKAVGKKRYVDDRFSIFETPEGFEAGSLSFSQGNYFVQERFGFSEMHPNPKYGRRSHPWNVALTDGTLVDANHPDEVVHEVPERDSNPIVEYPLALGFDVSEKNGQGIVMGVLRDLVEFKEVHRFTIYQGRLPQWYRQRQAVLAKLDSAAAPDPRFGISRSSPRSNDARAVEKQFLDPLPIKLLAASKNGWAFLFGSKIIFAPKLDLEGLEYAKPLQLETSPIAASFNRPFSVECLVTNAVGAATLRVVNESDAITIDPDTNAVVIDPQAAWRDFRARVMNSATPTSARKYVRSRLDTKKRIMFRKLYGREPTSVPFSFSIAIEARDSLGSVATVYRSIPIEVPDSTYLLLEKDFNRGLAGREESIGELADAMVGPLVNEIDGFVATVNDQHSKLKQMPNVKNGGYASLQIRLRKIETDLTKLSVDRTELLNRREQIYSEPDAQFHNLAGLHESELELGDRLRRSIESDALWPWILLPTATLFYFSSLIFLLRSRPRTFESSS